jgi:hypothetical protein
MELRAKWKLIREDLIEAGVVVLTKNRRQNLACMMAQPTTFVGEDLVVTVTTSGKGELLKLSKEQTDYVRCVQERAHEYLIEKDEVMLKEWKRILNTSITAWLQSPLEDELKIARGTLKKARTCPALDLSLDDRVGETEDSEDTSANVQPAKKLRGKGKKEPKKDRDKKELQKLAAEKEHLAAELAAAKSALKSANPAGTTAK